MVRTKHLTSPNVMLHVVSSTSKESTCGCIGAPSVARSNVSSRDRMFQRWRKEEIISIQNKSNGYFRFQWILFLHAAALRFSLRSSLCHICHIRYIGQKKRAMDGIKHAKSLGYPMAFNLPESKPSLEFYYLWWYIFAAHLNTTSESKSRIATSSSRLSPVTSTLKSTTLVPEVPVTDSIGWDAQASNLGFFGWNMEPSRSTNSNPFFSSGFLPCRTGHCT